MVKKTVIAASLAVLAIGAGRPAAATPTFLEPYGNIVNARTLQGDKDDTRAKDAVRAQTADEEAPKPQLILSPFFRHFDVGDFADATVFGGGLAYASAGKHEWQINAQFFNTNVDPDFGDDNDEFGWSVGGKYVLAKPASSNGPVISIFTNYLDINNGGNRWDVGLAADQQIAKNLYGTANLGFGHIDPDFGDDSSALIPAVGLTYVLSPRLSVSADYTFDNAVDTEDTWTAGAIYAFNDQTSIRFGGGKHNLFFGNLFWRFGK